MARHTRQHFSFFGDGSVPSTPSLILFDFPDAMAYTQLLLQPLAEHTTSSPPAISLSPPSPPLFTAFFPLSPPPIVSLSAFPYFITPRLSNCSGGSLLVVPGLSNPSPASPHITISLSSHPMTTSPPSQSSPSNLLVPVHT